MRLLHFLQYNNAVPIGLAVLFLGAGGAFAASNPAAIYTANQKVITIDNTYIANKNLSSYSPKVVITGVTEDAEYYFVTYRFTSIDIQDYVWKDIMREEVMRVSKVDLGPYRDLGLYVTEQLKQIVDKELERLLATQEFERRNVTQKTIATEYGGLVGKLLDSTTEELPGYVPVVTPPPPPPTPEPEPEPQVAAAVVPTEPTQLPPPHEPTQEPPQVPPAEPIPQAVPQTEESSTPPAVDSTTSTSTPTSTPPVVLPPTMQLLGDSTISLLAGEAYTDLGATITGPAATDLALPIRVFVNGQEVVSVAIDTSAVGTWTIAYEATNSGGATRVERVLIVSEAPPPIEQATSSPVFTEPSASTDQSVSLEQSSEASDASADMSPIESTAPPIDDGTTSSAELP